VAARGVFWWRRRSGLLLVAFSVINIFLKVGTCIPWPIISGKSYWFRTSTQLRGRGRGSGLCDRHGCQWWAVRWIRNSRRGRRLRGRSSGGERNRWFWEVDDDVGVFCALRARVGDFLKEIKTR
jgi:hypothetical protein